MARWDPDAAQRLYAAALHLYEQRGFDAVTVTEIAARAGLTRRSFFRHYADKREVLFGGSERLPPALYDHIVAAPPAVGPVDAVLAAVTAAAQQLLTEVDSAMAARRQAIISASPELQERERSKLAAVAEAVENALLHRSVEPVTARLVAQMGTSIFVDSYRRHLEEPGGSPAESITAGARLLRSQLDSAALHVPKDA